MTSKEKMRPMLDRLERSSPVLVERRPGDAHVDALVAQAGELVQRERILHCVLSGKATSIQAVNRRIRGLGLTSKQIRSKAYCAPGKRGLD